MMKLVGGESVIIGTYTVLFWLAYMFGMESSHNMIITIKKIEYKIWTN